MTKAICIFFVLLLLPLITTTATAAATIHGINQLNPLCYTKVSGEKCYVALFVHSCCNEIILREYKTHTGFHLGVNVVATI